MMGTHITFKSDYELLMYLYRLWHAWRLTQGADPTKSNGTDAEEAAFAAAFNAGIMVSDSHGSLSSASMVPLPIRAAAILEMLHAARSWLDPDLTLPPVEEWLAMTDAERDACTQRAAKRRKAEERRRGW